MFTSFRSLKNFSGSVGGYVRSVGRRYRNYKKASTTFEDSTGPVMKITFLVGGSRGNNYVANLLKITATKYRFRLYNNAGTRLNTITEEDAVAPPNVIENLVASINGNATFKKYIHATFYKETTEAISASINIGDGQRLTGGR
jgi:hypothetical protein